MPLLSINNDDNSSCDEDGPMYLNVRNSMDYNMGADCNMAVNHNKGLGQH